ncbi:hypothetical protein BS17DRAFT_765079 [Gyrodon lividus]|nr:hypothetical protein BS17DRAFT_765079 [Gyrodon lividus]
MEERKRHTKALAVWKKLEDVRKAENKVQWECEKAHAKAAKQKFGEKPILGKLLPAIPHPKVLAVVEEDGSDGEEFYLDDDGALVVFDKELVIQSHMFHLVVIAQMLIHSFFLLPHPNNNIFPAQNLCRLPTEGSLHGKNLGTSVNHFVLWSAVEHSIVRKVP